MRTSAADVFSKEMVAASSNKTEKRKLQNTKTSQIQQKVLKDSSSKGIVHHEDSISDTELSIKSLEFGDSLSNETLQQLLKDCWHKQSNKKIKEILSTYTDDITTLITHLNEFREYTINNSTKPQNQVSRIDRLVVKIKDIVSSSEGNK